MPQRQDQINSQDQDQRLLTGPYRITTRDQLDDSGGRAVALPLICPRSHGLTVRRSPAEVMRHLHEEDVGCWRGPEVAIESAKAGRTAMCFFAAALAPDGVDRRAGAILPAQDDVCVQLGDAEVRIVDR